MEILALFAISGGFYNDVLALVSVTGCILWFIGSFPKAHRLYTEIGEWSSAPVVFGSFFQVSMIVTELVPEKIGFVLPMAPGLVNALFAASGLLLIGRWWMKRNLNKEKSNV